MIEMTVVEAIGGRAEDKAPGSWIHVNSMSPLHCLPGNCVSCADAANTAYGMEERDLEVLPLSVEEFVQILERGGNMRQNLVQSMTVSNGSGIGPPPNATCTTGGSPSCLAWEQQVIGTCCRRGHLGTLCASCDVGWVKVKGLCRPCQSFDYARLILLMGFYGAMVAYFCYKARQIKEPKHVDQKCQSAGLTISTFFLQTAALLEFDMGVRVNIGVLNLELNSVSQTDTDTEGKCISTGSFYMDWALKFSVPLMMALLYEGGTVIHNLFYIGNP
jgi:hypothetical protein